MSIVLLACFLLVVLYVSRYYANVLRLPRGPTPLPLVGNLFQFDPRRLELFLERCYDSYGSVFTVYLPHPMVIVSDFDDIKELYVSQGDHLTGRTGRFPDTAFMARPNGGVIFNDGDNWREQRRAALHILRDSGMGKGVMERRVHDSLEEFFAHLSSLVGEKSELELRWPLQILVVNIINNVLFGFHYKYDESDRLVRFIKLFNYQLENLRSNLLGFLCYSFPWITCAPLLSHFAVGRFLSYKQKLVDHVHEDIQSIMKSFDPEHEPECFVHAYMQRSLKNPALSEHEMLSVCLDFFLAGSETTSTALRWALLYLAAYPKVQEKMRAEIDAAVFRHRFVAMSDRPQLPYTHAAVLETLRIANIVPVNLIRRATAEIKVREHVIPANSFVIGQIYHVLGRSKLFANDAPEAFRPERFLLPDGKTTDKDAVEQMVAFSMGRRQCAGEGLARMELFLVLASLVQRFSVAPASGRPLDLRRRVGLVAMPHEQPLAFTALA